MRVTYRWTEREWHEAVALSSIRQQRRPVLPGLTGALILLPLIGGTGEFIVNIHRTHQLTLAGTILPLLLIMFAVVVAMLALLTCLLRRKKRKAIRATMPTGEWEAALQEAGWRFTLIPDPDQLLVFHAETEKPAAFTLNPWSDLAEVRHSDRVIVLMHHDGFHAVPVTSLTPEQSSHLYRLVTRKLRPAPSR